MLVPISTRTKYAHVVPLDRKSSTPWRNALKAIIAKMGKPKQIYSDPDASLSSRDVRAYLKDEGIEHIQTREHAPIAERTIRTLKSLLDKRMEDAPKIWTAYLPDVLKKYNEKMVHSAIGMTPQEAKQETSTFYVKTKLEVNKIKNRKYPPLELNDKVRLYKKKSRRQGASARLGGRY
jgi:transposase InsO family protein